MASNYHPFFDSLWDDDKLEGASFEGKAFFAFLFTNPRIRPSGIYRVTDAQLAAETTLPVTRVKGYLADLHARRLIVRDGSWLFVRGYFKRQPKGQNLLKGVAADVDHCSSADVLNAFATRYPVYAAWAMSRLELLRLEQQTDALRNPTPSQWSAIGRPPLTGIPSTEHLQLQLQSRAVTEQSKHVLRSLPEPRTPAALPPSTATVAATHTNGWQIPSSIRSAVERSPRLCAVPRLHAPAFWQAEIRANPGVDLAREVLKAEAYLAAHPEKHYKRLTGFLHNWFGRADRPEGEG